MRSSHLLSKLIWRMVATGSAVMGLTFSISSEGSDLCGNKYLLSDEEVSILSYISQVVDRDIAVTSELLTQIGRDYPMARHEYVFVGRSPTLLAALAAEYKVHFPQLRSWILPVTLSKGSGEKTFRQRRDSLVKLMGVFRPPEFQNDRVLVFIDTIGDGTTMTQLEMLTGDMVSPDKPKFAVLTADVLRVQRMIERRIIPIFTKIISLSDQYENEIGKHKLLSAYDSVDLGSSIFTESMMKPNESNRFRLLRGEIRKRIEAGEI